jgi:predicted nucleic acid-binding protein
MYLIVDANVLLGAVIGKSLPLLAEIASRDGVLLVPSRMMIETRSVAADVNRVPLPGALERLTLIETMVTLLDPIHYEHEEGHARDRLTSHGQNDWPVLAAAIALDAPVWSNDKHLWGVGVAVWLTRNIRFWDPVG